MTNFENVTQDAQSLLSYYDSNCATVCSNYKNDSGCAGKNCISGKIRWLGLSVRPSLTEEKHQVAREE